MVIGRRMPETMEKEQQNVVTIIIQKHHDKRINYCGSFHPKRLRSVTSREPRSDHSLDLFVREKKQHPTPDMIFGIGTVSRYP